MLGVSPCLLPKNHILYCQATANSDADFRWRSRFTADFRFIILMLLPTTLGCNLTKTPYCHCKLLPAGILQCYTRRFANTDKERQIQTAAIGSTGVGIISSSFVNEMVEEDPTAHSFPLTFFTLFLVLLFIFWLARSLTTSPLARCGQAHFAHLRWSYPTREICFIQHILYVESLGRLCTDPTLLPKV